MLRVQLFGRVAVVRGDGTPVALETRKVALLAAVLGLRPGRPYPREALAAAVWPDSEPEAGRASLRVALSTLRKALGDDAAALLANRLECSFDADAVTSDTGDFFAAIRGSRIGDTPGTELLERAIGLYSAKPLDGLDGAWVDWARGLLRKRLEEARTTLVEALVAAGEFARAAEAGLAALERQPGSEAVARHTLVALQHLGRGIEAVEVFERLKRSLWDSHRVAPAADLAALLPHTAEPPKASASLDLPLALGRMIGREAELASLTAVLDPKGGERLVTVMGTGGIGKTRLLIEAARELRERFKGRLAWADLSFLRDPAQIVPSALAAVGLRSGADDLPQLHSRLGSGPYLLLLDNLEQFGAGARAPLEQLLGAHPELMVLASSRQRIETPGERVFPLTPLATTGEDDRTIPAVELFIELADRNRAGIDWDEVNLVLVRETVQTLEGLPLSIRLAANKADVLSPAEIRSQVADRFSLLRDGDDGLPERQRSLWASIEWTYELLPSAKSFFAQVAHFPAPFTLEACSRATGEADSLDLAQLLVRRSLLSAEQEGGQTRYRMLESVREFGQRALDPVLLPGLRERYIAHYERWCDTVSDEFPGVGADAAMRVLPAEEANIRLAFEWALEDAPNSALSIAYSIATYFDACGRYWDAIRWLDQAEAAAGDGADPEMLAGSASDRAQCYVRLRRPDQAVQALEERIGLLDRVSNRTKFHFLTSLGSSSLMDGRLEQAWEHFFQARSSLTEDTAAGLYATALGNEALAHLMLGNLDEAESLARESLALAEAQSRRPGMGSCLYTLAHVAMCRGDLEKAAELCRESIGVLEEGGLNAALSGRFTFLSESLSGMGRLSESLGSLQRSVDRLLHANMERDLADCARAAGVWCLAAGDEVRAATFLSFYEPYLGGGFPGRSRSDPRPTVPEMLRDLEASLDAEVFGRASATGRAWSVADLPRHIGELTVPEPGGLRA
ncbi:MAG: BTAD domain-containing putative transcriptional regulator [Fimbriimonadaceae bacterium]